MANVVTAVSRAASSAQGTLPSLAASMATKNPPNPSAVRRPKRMPGPSGPVSDPGSSKESITIPAIASAMPAH
jgi:hypothetical protein